MPDSSILTKKTIIGGVAAAVTTTGALFFAAAPAHAEEFTVCPSGMSGVATDDTSCAFADNVFRAWYAQPGTIVRAYSPVTHQSYTMQCTSTVTTFWPEAKRCVGLNSYGVGLIVYVD